MTDPGSAQGRGPRVRACRQVSRILRLGCFLQRWKGSGDEVELAYSVSHIAKEGIVRDYYLTAACLTDTKKGLLDVQIKERAEVTNRKNPSTAVLHCCTAIFQCVKLDMSADINKITVANIDAIANLMYLNRAENTLDLLYTSARCCR